MIAGMTYYQICWYFIMYSFIGWVIEVIYHAAVAGKIINRGFLNGPVCPVYGLGMLAVIAMLNSVTSSKADTVTNANTAVVFVGGMILATAVEFIAGWLLNHIFHTKCWDYSNKPFNIGGYVCLEFSLLWGLGTVLAVKVFHRMINDISADGIPPKIGWPLLALLYTLLLIDLIITVMTMIGLNKKLEELDTIRSSMRVFSDAMSQKIGKESLETAQKLGEAKVQAALAKAELYDAAESKTSEAIDHAAKQHRFLEDRASAIYSDITSRKLFGSGRLLRTYPGMKHSRYYDALHDILAKLNK